MAKFPYTCTGTKTVLGDGSIQYAVVIKDGNAVTVKTDTITVPPNTQPAEAFTLLSHVVRYAFFDSIAASDLPATFSFNFNPQDLL